uniref:Pro-corazonin n=1 Tax=Bactrocera dorsalis TaxID=27457 RepID=A0A034UZ70_BACDO|nr:plastid corazonin [Bactrocera dorsalis]
MFKLFFSLAVLCFLATCFGQTFQYSHGWTSGKRAVNTHRDNDIAEMLQQDGDRKLERCLMQLQYLLHNPLSIRAGVQALTPANGNLFGNRHQSNELYEELNAAETNDYGKH